MKLTLKIGLGLMGIGLTLIFLPIALDQLNYEYSLYGNATRHKIIDGDKVNPKESVELYFSPDLRKRNALSFSEIPSNQTIKYVLTYPNGEIVSQTFRGDPDIGGWTTPFDPKTFQNENIHMQVTNMGTKPITLGVNIFSSDGLSDSNKAGFISVVGGNIVFLIGIVLLFVNVIGRIRKNKPNS